MEKKRNSFLKYLGPVDPCPVEWVEMVDAPKWTICQVLNEIYKLTNDPKIKIRVRIAVTMAKKMSDRLTELKDGFTSSEWTEDTQKMKTKYQ